MLPRNQLLTPSPIRPWRSQLTLPSMRLPNRRLTLPLMRLRKRMSSPMLRILLELRLMRQQPTLPPLSGLPLSCLPLPIRRQQELSLQLQAAQLLATIPASMTSSLCPFTESRL